MKNNQLMKPLEELMPRGLESVDPSHHHSEVFELFSIPSYDVRSPEVLLGSSIGSAKKRVEPGDVLLSRIVPHIRRAWVVPRSNGHRQIASSEWIVFRSSKFIPNYLRHFLMCDFFHTQFMNTVAGVGGSLLRARPAFVGKIDVPLPPLSEQKRIADILDKADAIRRKRQEAANLSDNFATTLFDARFGDPILNRHGRDLVPLGELFAEPPNYGTMVKPTNVPGGWLDLRVANIQEGKLTLADRKYVDLPDEMIHRHEVRGGDLLLARAIGSLDHLGKCIVAEPSGEKWAFDSHLMRLRFDQRWVRPRYIHAFLTSPGGRHEFLANSRRSAVQFNINTKEIARIRVPLPPLSEQDEFICELGKVRRLQNRQSLASQVFDNLFDSLLQRAFSGEL